MYVQGTYKNKSIGKIQPVEKCIKNISDKNK